MHSPQSTMTTPSRATESSSGIRIHLWTGMWLIMTMSLMMLQFEVLRSTYDSRISMEDVPRVLSTSAPPPPRLRTIPIMKNRVAVPEAPMTTTKLDFFIAGFPKCGTTTLLYTFNAHNETSISDREFCGLINTEIPDRLALSKLNDELKSLPPGKRGIKCPQGLKTSRSIERLQQHSPEARLVIGVRHPVHFLQSYYNYRITEIHDRQLDDAVPPIETLIGKDDWKGVSTDNARFELFLMQLGKTNMTTTNLNELLGRQHMSVKPNSFKIFLYSLEQMEDENETRKASFRSTLETFLQLDHSLKPIGHENLNHFVGDKAHQETIDICQRKYRKLRRVLVTQAQETKRWIRDEFLQSPDVIVANKEHFLETLSTWDVDPCPQVFVKRPPSGLPSTTSNAAAT